MPIIITLALVVVALLVYWTTQANINTRAATRRLARTERAVGVAVQGLRELRRTTLTGSDQEFIVNQTLADTELALQEAKETN